MLAPSLRRHGSNRAFHQLQQRLLHTLARHIAGDRRVFGLAGDLVDFVDVDDAALCLLDIIVGGLQQLENDVFHVLAHVTGFGQRGGVGHGEGHVEDPRQRLRQQGLAAPCRADQQDVGLGQLDVGGLLRMVQALVVVVHRHRQHALGLRLPDHEVIEDGVNIGRGRNTVGGLGQPALALFADDVHAQLDAFVADEHRRTGNQLADFVLAFATEGTVQRVFAVAHRCRHLKFQYSQ